jgi:hypothetical protein
MSQVYLLFHPREPEIIWNDLIRENTKNFIPENLST